MSNQQALAMALTKAINNGFETPTKKFEVLSDKGPVRFEDNMQWNFLYIIYSHDFAKALWGEPILDDKQRFKQYGWKWHLQHMVIADDPIKYLEENL